MVRYSAWNVGIGRSLNPEIIEVGHQPFPKGLRTRFGTVDNFADKRT